MAYPAPNEDERYAADPPRPEGAGPAEQPTGESRGRPPALRPALSEKAVRATRASARGYIAGGAEHCE